MTHLSELTVRNARKQIENGQLTSEQLIQAYIELIEERDSDIHAWAYFDKDRALAAARASDQGGNIGPLGGIPVGVKDIIDTFDMPTEYGSPIYRGNQPSSDATCVAKTRQAGAIIMGKTKTTEFAHQFPADTCNPHNTAHTPGGSSSGSGAAVASFMIPLAFGTQTGGSVIRPAAFCGVVGYKPTYGEFGLKGVKENAQCCDTVGLYARSVDDISLFRSALLEIDPSPLQSTPLNRLRIGICRTHAWDQAEPVMRDLLADAASELAKAGATVADYDLSDAV
ncbi:MAG: amidase, partial [Haliea sp.]